MKASMAVRRVVRCTLGAVTIFVFANTTQAQAGKLIQGPCGQAFGAKVCTSYRIVAGDVTALIMRVPLATIKQAASSDPMGGTPTPDVIVPFADAAQKQTGFTFTNLYWDPAGHPPAAYMTPHFDFHFYFAPEAQVQTIDCKDAKKPEILPAGYSLPDITIPHMGTMIGSCIPAMGMHAVPSSDLHRKTPWKGSLVVGYYAGKPLFLEPMITRALLLKEHSFSLPVPKIAATSNVRYPKTFRAIYHPKIKAYDFVMLY